MAKLEHVELVRQGTESILKWQRQNPDLGLDLEGANLSKADLGGVRGAHQAHAIETVRFTPPITQTRQVTSMMPANLGIAAALGPSVG